MTMGKSSWTTARSTKPEPDLCDDCDGFIAEEYCPTCEALVCDRCWPEHGCRVPPDFKPVENLGERPA